MLYSPQPWLHCNVEGTEKLRGPISDEAIKNAGHITTNYKMRMPIKNVIKFIL